MGTVFDVVKQLDTYFNIIIIATTTKSQKPRKVLSTIIPRVRMGSESIAHEVEGQMGY